MEIVLLAFQILDQNKNRIYIGFTNWVVINNNTTFVIAKIFLHFGAIELMNLYPIPRMVHLLQKDNSQNHYTSSYKSLRETFHQLIDDHICEKVLDGPNSMNIKSRFSVGQMPCEDRQFVIFSIRKKGRAMVSLDIFGDCNFQTHTVEQYRIAQ